MSNSSVSSLSSRPALASDRKSPLCDMPITATITRIATRRLVAVFLAVRISVPSSPVSQSIKNANLPEAPPVDLSLFPVSLIRK